MYKTRSDLEIKVPHKATLVIEMEFEMGSESGNSTNVGGISELKSINVIKAILTEILKDK